MSIAVTCSGCGTQYQIEDRLAGKKARCNQCGTVMQITRSAAPAAAPSVPQQAALDDFEDVGPLPTAPPPPPRRPAMAPVFERPAAMGLAGGGTATLEYSRPARRRTIAPVEGATPALVGLFILISLAVMGRGIYQYYQADASLRASLPSNMGATLALAYGVNVVLFFAIVGPLVMLGVFVGSKIMNFPMADGSYLKACGVAAVPAVVLGLMSFLPSNMAVVLLGVVAILPLAFYVLKFSFGLDLPSGLVSYIFAGMFYLGGMFLSGLIVATVVAAGFLGAAMNKQAGGGWAALPTPGNRGNSGSTAAPADPVTFAANSLRARLGVLIGRSTELASREMGQAELDGLVKEVQSFATANSNHAAVVELKQLLEEGKKHVETMVSELPPESIFVEAVPAAMWQATQDSSALGEELSYKSYRIRPAADALLDLTTSESDPRGLIWKTPRQQGAEGQISISAHSRGNAKQRTPWVVSKAFQKQSAAEDNLFYIEAEGAEVSHGTIGSLVFTKVTAKPDDGPFVQRWAKYVALAGDHWLVMDVRAPATEGQLFDLLESSAWTLRPAREGEAKSDPFAPERIAARLEDAPQQASAILRKQGKEAQDAVMAMLSHKNPRVQEQAVGLLAEIGGEKVIAAIREVARSGDRGTREAAKAALKKLSPREMDDVALALLDLEDPNEFFKRKAALETLAKAKGDERREKIAPMLEKMLMDREQLNMLDPTAKALAVWAGAKTGQNLLPALDQDGHPWMRRAAMSVMAEVKDPKTVFPVIRWMRLDRLNAIETLKAMGPVAEDEVIKLVSDRDLRVREDGIDILGAIGTAKSARVLGPLARDRRNQAISEAAQRALDNIKERNPTTKPGATTAPQRG